MQNQISARDKEIRAIKADIQQLHRQSKEQVAAVAGKEAEIAILKEKLSREHTQAEATKADYNAKNEALQSEIAALKEKLTHTLTTAEAHKADLASKLAAKHTELMEVHDKHKEQSNLTVAKEFELSSLRAELNDALQEIDRQRESSRTEISFVNNQLYETREDLNN